VLEDVPAGIQSGKASGARVIAFTTTVPASNLRHAGADWILRNCAGIRVVDCAAGLNLALTETADNDK
jgi:beta-phosphoglucomutase-like phosphatase (HAD superfamily)